MRVAVSGASGLIGSELVRRLMARGDEVVALGRDADRLRARLPGARAASWDPTAGPPPAEAIEGVDAVVHLAGEPIADRAWNETQKARIRDSRVLGTRNLVDAIEAAQQRPRTLVVGSAIGYYGDRGDEALDESSSPGSDFLAELCLAWEAETKRASALGLREVRVRTGIVLAREGGALPKLAMPFRFFAGGPLGSGRQWMSWVHLDDEVGLIQHALDHDAVTGPINVTAPRPVRNAEMAATIGRVLGRPALIPTPRAALWIALGERVEVLLASQRVLPRAAQAAGYQFRYPELAPALREALG